MRRHLFVACIILLSVSLGFSQDDEKRNVGLGVTLQSSQMDILYAPYVSDKNALFFGFGFTYIKNLYSDIAIGILPRFYLTNGKISPYIAIRGGAIFHLPEHGEKSTNILAGTAFGGEYFMDSRFSFGIEAQLNALFLNVNKPSTLNQSNITVNTATAFFGTIYF
jgi:hypothetical protein